MSKSDYNNLKEFIGGISLKNMIKFKILYYFSSAFCGLLSYVLAIVLAIKLKDFYTEISWLQQVLSVVAFYFTIRIIVFLSATLHELGHFLIGLTAKLQIDEFYVYPILIKSENNKLKIKFTTNLGSSGSGYCSTKMREDIAYNNTMLKLFVLGGIFVNLIISIISLLLFQNVYHILVKDLLIIVLFVNLGSIVLSIIPVVFENGSECDILRFINACKYPDYFQKNYEALDLWTKYEKGESVKNFQYECPDHFYTMPDVVYGILEADKLIEDDLLEDAKKLIYKIKKEAYGLLPEKCEIILSTRLLQCEFLSDKPNIEQLRRIWVTSVKNFFIEESKTNKSLLMYLYACAILVEENEDLALKYSEQFKEMSTDDEQKELDVWLEWCDFVKELKTS